MKKKQKAFVSYNQKGETIKIEIRDQTYKVIHRGQYKLRDIRDLHNLFSIIEKNISVTMQKILAYQDDDWF